MEADACRGAIAALTRHTPLTIYGIIQGLLSKIFGGVFLSSSVRNAMVPESSAQMPSVDQFNLSPLIRLTLLALYGALLVPLPFLAIATDAPVPAWLLGLGIGGGAGLLYVALSERVIVDDQQIQVTYPQWVPRFWRRGWSLAWTDITALKPRSTGQGGLVYYFLSRNNEAYLLPMRVAGFSRLVRYIQAKTQLPMNDVKPLAQPWMYIILLSFSLLFWLFDGWVVWMSLSVSHVMG